MTADRQRLRVFLVATMLTSAIFFLHTEMRKECLPPYTRLAAFPAKLGGWMGRDVFIDPGVRESLGQGDFMERTYLRPKTPMVDLFIAYFSSQRSGTTVHFPKNCLRGSGWMLIESGQMMLTNGEGRRFPVNRYVIRRGLDRQLVLHWFYAHDRIIASAYWAKLHFFFDAVSTNRTDGGQVRIVTPIAPDESPESAQQRAANFAQLLMPKLQEYIPR